MKNLKLIAVFAIVLCMVSSFAFAEYEVAPYANFEATTVTYGDSITVKVIAKQSITVDTALAAIMVSNTAWNISPSGSNVTYNSAQNRVELINNNLTTYNEGDVLVALTATPKAESEKSDLLATTFTLTGVQLIDNRDVSNPILYAYSDLDPATYVCTIKDAAPAGPVVKDVQVSDKGTTLELGGKTWTGLEVWEVSATVEGSAGTLTCSLSAEYTENGTPAAAPKALNAGSVIAHLEGATVTFRAAIVNMDEGIEITSLTPEFVVAAQ